MMKNPHIENRLLAMAGPDVLRSLKDRMSLVSQKLKTVIIEADDVVDTVYFPVDSVVSVLALASDTQPIEVGMIGSEGVIDFVGTRQSSTTPLRFIVQIPGSIWQMKASEYIQALHEHPSLAVLIVNFKQVLAIQFAYTAFANGTFNIDERLARWLLMSSDRIKKNRIPHVHEFLAIMLGVRRSSVTQALHLLEGRGAIRSTRGMVTIISRSILEEAAGSSYGVPEREYDRLLKG